MHPLSSFCSILFPINRIGSDIAPSTYTYKLDAAVLLCIFYFTTLPFAYADGPFLMFLF